MEAFKIKPWGPPKLRKIFEGIAAAINQRTPIEGIGIALDNLPDGQQISVRPDTAVGSKGAAGTGGGGSSGGSRFSFPFAMRFLLDGGGLPAVAIAPGMIEDVSPLLSGTRLDAIPAPLYYPAVGVTHLYLRVYITTDPDNAYRQAVDPDLTTVEEADADQEVLTVAWDDPVDRENGNFYVKLGVLTRTVGPPANVAISQVLFDNLMSLVYLGNDVVVLA